MVVSLPSCEEVNFATNRLSAYCGEEMKKLLQVVVEREVHCFVCITGNPLASIDAAAFLRELTEQERRHLVWVPKVFLPSTSSWEALIPADAVQLTRDTHEQYFGRDSL